MIAPIHRFFTAPVAKPNSPRVVFWFSLSLTFAVLYGLLGLQAAFSSEYIVQDDARMYVFWMQRFIDPDVLPHDLNVDYHKTISPIGYTALFWLMAKLGIEPLLLSKLLPIVLGVMATVYCFGLCLQILPVPTAAFTASLLMNQSLWLKDDIVSATPRGFVYPLFLAFLYYLLRGSLLPLVVAIALLGLFYPPLMFIAVGILIVRLLPWQKRQRSTPELASILTPSPHPTIPPSPHHPITPSPLLICAAGLGAALLVMIPYALSSSEFGPTVSFAQARVWPEFSGTGRIPFFSDDTWRFWFQANHTGIRLSLNPPLVGAGLLLPLLWRYPSRFPLVKQVSQKVIILPQILLVSLILFFTAHALFFRLFLPSRYTAHTLLMLVDITGGIALSVMLDAAFHAFEQPAARRSHQFLALGATILVAFTLIVYPNIFWKNFARTGYFLGNEPALYKFFQQQPKDTLIASTSDEAFDILTYSHRSVLVTRKLALPYHVGYYRLVRQRVMDLIRAQYSPNQAQVKGFIQKYKVDFWLLDRKAFTLRYLDNDWLKMFQPAHSQSVANLERGTTPVLASMMKRCSVFETKHYVVLQAKCIAKAANVREDRADSSEAMS